MNLTRLMVLGTLAGQGQLHGHQIRRIAEVSNVGYWGGVSVGALYRELRTMEGEGLVEAVRTEKVGRRPARTVYAITDEGRLELALLRERAITDTSPGQDPVGVALTFTGVGDDPAELEGWLRSRRDRVAIAAGQLADEEARLTAKGYLDQVSAAVMHRGVMHLETEVRWHDEFAKVLAALPASPSGPGDGGPAPAPTMGRAPAHGNHVDENGGKIVDQAGRSR